nr:hypothetical protein [Acinetobacter sp. YH16055]
MNGQKIDFLRFSKQGNKYFFPCKTKHRPYVTLANFPIQDPAHAGIFLSHTTHLTMTTFKALCHKVLGNYLM